MDQELVNTYYANVLNGFSPFVFEDKILLAKHISPVELFETNAHILGVKESLKSTVSSEYDIMRDSVEKGLWSYQKDMEIKKLEESIEKKRALIPKLVLPSQMKQVEAEAKNLEENLDKILEEKSKLLVNSLETRLNLEKRDYIAFCSVYTMEKARYWKYEDFLNEEASVVDTIILLYYKTVSKINSVALRAIAKQTDARLRLKNHQIDGKSDSIMLLELKQWCDFYVQIYDLEDKPDESIIMDDQKLDNWLTGRKAKAEVQKSVNNKGDNSFTGVITKDKDDLNILGATKSDTVLKMAKKGFE